MNVSKEFFNIFCLDGRRVLIFDDKKLVPTTGKMTHMVGWSHPDLLNECTGPSLNGFCDCSFDMVPHGFFQVMVIMVFLMQYMLYVPVFFVLLQSKDEDVYRMAMQSCISAANWQFFANSFTCDFEKGLYNAAKFNFGEAVFISCWFHWKQAIRRKVSYICA